MALQQSLADLHRAYRNYFRALAKAKAARARGTRPAQVHKPRCKSRRHDQACGSRPTAASVLPDAKLSLPKIGDLKVRWSRPLPADPSSVTITLDARAATRLLRRRGPGGAAARGGAAVGVDLGLTSFAALSTGEKVDNPRWLRQREKALRPSQRNMARKHKSSKNREKARRRSPGCTPGWPTPARTSTISSLPAWSASTRRVRGNPQRRRDRPLQAGQERPRRRVGPVHGHAGVQGGPLRPPGRQG